MAVHGWLAPGIIGCQIVIVRLPEPKVKLLPVTLIFCSVLKLTVPTWVFTWFPVTKYLDSVLTVPVWTWTEDPVASAIAFATTAALPVLIGILFPVTSKLESNTKVGVPTCVVNSGPAPRGTTVGNATITCPEATWVEDPVTSKMLFMKTQIHCSQY